MVLIHVTAVEDNGVIWKGVTVYFKTNAMSSQEDQYCLYIDNIELRNALQQAEENQTKITITFDDYIMKPFTKCDVETIAIITGIK